MAYRGRRWNKRQTKDWTNEAATLPNSWRKKKTPLERKWEWKKEKTFAIAKQIKSNYAEVCEVVFLEVIQILWQYEHKQWLEFFLLNIWIVVSCCIIHFFR